MSCGICNRKTLWHGSEVGRPGTYLSESGCQQGVRMDDDEYAEGWADDTIYPPCPFNPSRCLVCDGSGDGTFEADQDDCAACRGTGWAGGEAEWPERVVASVDGETRP